MDDEVSAGPANDSRAIPYPAIESHGLIGDRRTAALVAADGTIDWFCLPDFDGSVVFGALLDWFQGGFWRLGPDHRQSGVQSYEERSMILETRWEQPASSLLLRDVMLWPQADRPPEQANVRAIARVLRCERGVAQCHFEFAARVNFHDEAIDISEYSSGFSIPLPELPLRLWTTRPVQVRGSRLQAAFELQEGEEAWSVLELGAAGHSWSVESARAALEQNRQYWRQWVDRIRPVGFGDKEIRRTAMAVHSLTYAPEGSVVAAPTASLPERIGGGWNADYRLCWVRDASLSVGMLARLGELHETEQYLQWLVKRLARFGLPLQVLYDIRGGKRPAQRTLSGVAGYKHSQPVRLGNHAYKQHQLGSYGYLADCIWIYLQEGGPWREDYWKLLSRLANYTIKHWQKPENGLWELSERRHYVSSKVLSWVMLDRAIRIAQKVNSSFDTGNWQATREAIHAEVVEKGWSKRLGAFRQDYDSESLDASTLLIPIFDFLPADDPRVIATTQRIADLLAIDNFIYRFDPQQTPGFGDFPLGELEGAFFPSTFWLATTYARM
ncbi:MAG TPA: glycoside hydrolase family 15 protein, partial [Verrucomicrobiae bacterium]|nr:glycoside hydrolase family 15 protein [Verrucomicrobiae bacterium]